MMINKRIEGLYIHIPFCDAICSYCDFYKMRAKDELKEKYIKYLIKEIYLKKEYLPDIKTIYIGGGTPSSLNHNLLEKLFTELKNLIDFNNIIEFTIEANPCDINEDFINLIKINHITRLSLGVQSFDNNVLKQLGRQHDSHRAIESLKLLKQLNFNNVNIDLIYGVKSDTFTRVRKDIKVAKKLGVKHFSIYSLIIEQKTLLAHLESKGKFTRLDDANDSKIYYKMVKYLKRHKYHQYEVSNFCLENYQSIHNLIYWNNNYFLGLGPSASYYYNETRYTNINNLEQYFVGIDQEKLNFLEESKLSLSEQMTDEILMGFRKVQGLNILEFERKYNKDVFEVFPKIYDLINQGLIKQKKEYLFVSQDKLFILNAILVAIM